MPNDPSPLPEISTALKSADYQAVYAAIVASEAGRNFLVEYARRHGHQDAHRLVGTIARLDAAVRDAPPAQLLAALAANFADLGAAIKLIEAVLSPRARTTPDVHFAIERMQDIAAAVRSRGVEASLCDSLEAAIREVGDAIVRGDAAAAGALSAAHLLHDLARRAETMTGLLTTAQFREPEQCYEPASTPAAVAGDRGLGNGAQPQPNRRAPFDDALAPLLALSEEELIALFS